MKSQWMKEYRKENKYTCTCSAPQENKSSKYFRVTSKASHSIFKTVMVKPYISLGMEIIFNCSDKNNLERCIILLKWQEKSAPGRNNTTYCS